MTTVRLLHLYPEQLNIYADRGNIAVLRWRLAQRGHELEVVGHSPGAGTPATDAHLVYAGGGQDRDQAMVAGDLQGAPRAALQAMAADGVPMLFVCGSLQLAGHAYEAVDGSNIPGVGILDLETTAGDDRLIGDILLDAELPGDAQHGGKNAGPVIGYENHAGRTSLGTDARPFGTVRSGHGNDGTSGFEGAVQHRVVGTYIHGPLLPKNPWVADTLLAWALERAGDTEPLTPLDDTFEKAAFTRASERLGVDR